jgi:hypothetical protein
LKLNASIDAAYAEVLEINLVTFPNVADAILGQGKLTHYDRRGRVEGLLAARYWTFF